VPKLATERNTAKNSVTHFLALRDWLKNKVPERGGAGFARTPSLWNFIYLLTPKQGIKNIL